MVTISLWLLPAPSAVWSDLIFRQPITPARFLMGPISQAMSRKRSTQRSWGTISVKSMCHLNFTILTDGKNPSVPLLSLVSCIHLCLMLLLLLLFTLIQEIEIVTLIFFSLKSLKICLIKSNLCNLGEEWCTSGLMIINIKAMLEIYKSALQSHPFHVQLSEIACRHVKNSNCNIWKLQYWEASNQVKFLDLSQLWLVHRIAVK